jgi:hypothetical protein
MDGDRIRGRGTSRTTDSEETSDTATEAEQPGEPVGAANGAGDPEPEANGDAAGEPAAEPVEPVGADTAESEDAEPAEPAEPVGPAEPAGSEASEEASEADGEPDLESESESESAPADGATGALTITLPDGSESVSEAILTNRRMLTEPAAHDLAPAAELEELRESVDRLSAAVPEDLAGEMETLEASVDEVADGLDRQQRQIQELTDTVASLAEILGASVEFETLEHDGS